MASPSEDRNRDETPPSPTEVLYKTKLIQFLGRTTPIVLQNDNGPCPLLAICNVLLLRNNISLSADEAEVSQAKLLQLVAERLLDSNSNVDNKDAEYVKNQLQNIADAMELLPQLATGIDVNIKFTRIGDFEFTRECAIFDLLDIPLYHGWIVDPQDSDTAAAIGLKSYNTLVGELVALDTQNPVNDSKKNPEEDSVDFVAATTASLGVPSPSLARGRSFDDAPHSVSGERKGKGDLEEEELLSRALKLSSISDEQKREGEVEEEELSRALKLSETETPTLANDIDANEVEKTLSEYSNGACLERPEFVVLTHTVQVHTGAEVQKSCQQESSISDDNNVMNNCNHDLETFGTVPVQDVCSSSEVDKEIPNGRIDTSASEKHDVEDGNEKTSIDVSVKTENDALSLSSSDPQPPPDDFVQNSGEDEKIQDQKILMLDVSCSSAPDGIVDSYKAIAQPVDESKSLTSSADGSEPIYEGEECILETSTTTYEDREPMYEGEVVLAEQVDKASSIPDDTRLKDGITPGQGECIRNFLKNSASQLTIYGLFCLQEGLKERELCVFFRNNHFNTMFKFESELYLLATDQGYISQPDLVWEKLNEVNGDTVYVTGNFKEFKVENPETRSWDEQNAMATTADYLAQFESTEQSTTSINSDLQLAIALQQQEFDQQQQPPQRNLPQSTANGGSRLITGPQHVQPSRPRNSSPSSRQDHNKSKEKCTVM